MFCTKCGSKLDDDAMFCGKCGTKIAGRTIEVIKEIDEYDTHEVPKKEWYQELYENDELWFAKAFDEYPEIISHEYSRLREMIGEGQIYGCLLQIKDVFEVILKLPLVIVLGGCEQKIRSLLQQDGLTKELLKADYRNLFKIITLVTEKPISLGDWEQIGHLTKDLNIQDDLPNNVDIYSNLVFIITKIMKKYKIGKTTISMWRNNTIGHGALSIDMGDSKNEFREEFITLIEKIKEIMMISETFYDSVVFDKTYHDCDNGNAVITTNGMKITSKATNISLPLEPYYISKEDKGYIFDSYVPYKNSAHVLNYSHGMKMHSDEIAIKFSNIIRDMAIEFITPNDIFDETLNDEDINSLENVMKDKKIMKPVHFHEWVEEMLAKHTKGTFMMKADRGMGKSVFCNALDDLDEASYKNGSSSFKNVVVRVYRANSYYNSRLDIFKGTIITLLQSWISFDNNDRKVINGNRFKGKVATKCFEFASKQHVDPKEAKLDFANLIHLVFEEYQKSDVNLEKMFLIIDGVDEIVKEDNEDLGILDYIPGKDELHEGVYILLTSRTDNETQENKYIKNQLQQIDYSESAIFDRNNSTYLKVIRSFVEKHIGGNDTVDQLLQLSSNRFVYLGAYKRLIENNVNINDLNNDKLLTTYFELIKSRSVKHYNNILDMMMILVIAPEPITLRELVFVMGYETMTYRELSLVMEMRHFLEFVNSDRGRLITVSHELWVYELLNSYHEEIESKKYQVEKRLISIIEESNLQKDDNLSDEIYDGETWLLSNFEIFGIKSMSFDSLKMIHKYVDHYNLIKTNPSKIDRKIKILTLLIEGINGVLTQSEQVDTFELLLELTVLYRKRGDGYRSKLDDLSAGEDYDKAYEILDKLYQNNDVKDLEYNFEDQLCLLFRRGSLFASDGYVNHAVSDFNQAIGILESMSKSQTEDSRSYLLSTLSSVRVDDTHFLGLGSGTYDEIIPIMEELYEKDYRMHSYIHPVDLVDCYLRLVENSIEWLEDDEDDLISFEEAMLFIEKAIVLMENYIIEHKESGHFFFSSRLVEAYSSKGKLHKAKGNLDLALIAYDATIDKAKNISFMDNSTINDMQCQISNLMLLKGDAFAESGDVEKALDEYNEASDIVKMVLLNCDGIDAMYAKNQQIQIHSRKMNVLRQTDGMELIFKEYNLLIDLYLDVVSKKEVWMNVYGPFVFMLINNLVNIYSERGYLYHSAGEMKLALKDYNTAINTMYEYLNDSQFGASNNLEIFQRRGDTYYALGNFEMAEIDFEFVKVQWKLLEDNIAKMSI